MHGGMYAVLWKGNELHHYRTRYLHIQAGSRVESLHYRAKKSVV